MSSRVHHLISILIALTLLLGASGRAFAQATPEAAGGGGPSLGDAVNLVDSSGEPVLRLTVSTLTDPDDNAGAADRGFHWVGIELSVENLYPGEYSFGVYPITLVDGEGFTATPSYTNRSDDDLTARPTFVEGNIPDGGTITGWVFFQVLNGTSPSWIVFNDAYGTQQFAVLANLDGAEVAPGDAVPFFDSSADELGTVTIDEIITGFEDVDASVSPPRGLTTIGLVVTIENTGTADLQPNPSIFYLVDDYGYLYYPSYYSRDGTSAYLDLSSETLAPGGSASGVILYEVPAAATVSVVVFQPDSSQLYILALSSDGGMGSAGGSGTPVAQATTAVVESADCEDATDWADASRENFAAFTGLAVFQSDSLADVTPEDMNEASRISSELATAQDALEPPAVAEALDSVLIEFFDSYADLFDEAAVRIAAGEDPAAIDAEYSERPEIEALITTLFGEITALGAECPNLDLSGILG